jgi:hypothetical protein
MSLHGDEESGGDGAHVVGIGEGFTLVYVHFVYIDFVFVYRSDFFEYGSQCTTGTTPLGIEIYDGRAVTSVAPLGMWGAVVGHTMEEVCFSQMDNVHTMLLKVLSIV